MKREPQKVHKAAQQHEYMPHCVGKPFAFAQIEEYSAGVEETAENEEYYGRRRKRGKQLAR